MLTCILLARPFAESGFDDDWSYSHVAMKFAETGRLHYNGWGSPMLIPQVIWGAAWIRVFGFSFDMLRVATLPFSLGFVSLVYALGVKIGLRPSIALFGTLTVGTSPLFLPLAASFMTEAYACFFTMLCIYAAISSAESEDAFPAALWLWILAVSGIVGGADRQTVWVAPIALIPYLAWTKRLERRFSLNAVAAYALCITAIAILLAKFSQPYGPLQVAKAELLSFALNNLPLAFAWLTSILLSCLLVAFPALLFVLPLWKRPAVAGLISAAIMVFFYAVFATFGFAPLGVVPFAGTVLTRVGILSPWLDAMGFRPDTLPLWLRLGLTWALFLSVIACARLCEGKDIQASVGPRTVAVFAIVAGSYVPFLLPGALGSIIYDRYVLPLFPLLVLSLLRLFQSDVRKIPVAAWGCLLLFAAYGVTTTHDYFANLRARTLAAQALEARGIPRAHISAGFEYDGWTQLQLAGTVKGTALGDPKQIDPSRFWFWHYTTALQPDYVVTYSERPATGIGSLAYTTWFPPFRRYVRVLRREELPKPSPNP